MCVHGLPFFPYSDRIHVWLTKLYGKLGLVTLAQKICSRFPSVPEQTFTSDIATAKVEEAKQEKNGSIKGALKHKFNIFSGMAKTPAKGG